MKAFGYWKATENPNLPEPFKMVGEYPDQELKDKIIQYLKSGNDYHHWMGNSYCRFGCNREDVYMGSRCFSDSVWIWPEGYYHYIERHNVLLPELVLEHMVNNNFHIPFIEPSNDREEHDYTDWIEFGKQTND